MSYILIAGDIADAHAEFESIRLVLHESDSRCSLIRDPLQYIIMPMLRPQLLFSTHNYRVYECANKFYTERIPGRIETLGGMFLTYSHGKFTWLRRNTWRRTIDIGYVYATRNDEWRYHPFEDAGVWRVAFIHM